MGSMDNICDMLLTLLVHVVLLSPAGAYQVEEPLLYATFPKGFKWGVATAAYQVEGGWNASGKGESIWDRFTRRNGTIVDGSSGEISCDSYNKYQADVDLIKDMGLSSYRFSISWPRVLPSGTGPVNPAGLAYYHALIDSLLLHGIEPVVTLYHWDLPQALQERGGWLNDSVADWFEEFADVIFKELGHKVKTWITLNEPWVTAIEGYGEGDHAPGLHGLGTLVYQVAHNQLRAHAKVYRLYQQKFRRHQQGKVGITLSINWAEASNSSRLEDRLAADRMMQFQLGWFAHPIFIDGRYPPVMRKLVDEKSSAQGFPQSRLPTFTKQERMKMAGSADFLGINMYTSQQVQHKHNNIDDVSYYADYDAEGWQDPSWYRTGSSWLAVTPWGLRSVMSWVRSRYGNLQFYITENGTSDKLGNLDDIHRIYFYKHYINQLLKAILLDKIQVHGYFAWSLLDNFEWARGYTEHFGLHSVNMTDPARKRTKKASSQYYKQIVEKNGFVESEGPCTNKLTLHDQEKNKQNTAWDNQVSINVF